MTRRRWRCWRRWFWKWLFEQAALDSLEWARAFKRWRDSTWLDEALGLALWLFDQMVCGGTLHHAAALCCAWWARWVREQTGGATV